MSCVLITKQSSFVLRNFWLADSCKFSVFSICDLFHKELARL